MKFFDSHLHFWDLNNKINTWVLRQANMPFLNKDYLPKDLFQQTDLYGIAHIEAHDFAIPTIQEILWLGTIMKKQCKVKYAHIAFADITLPNHEFRTVIDQIKPFKFVKGIRHILSSHPRYQYSPCDNDLSKHKNILANLYYLSENNLLFNCQMYPYQLHKFIPYVKESQVTCIIDHIALPVWDNESDRQLWKDIIVELAKNDKVFVKLSGLDMFQPKQEFATIINYCLNTIPNNKLLYGTNYPVSFNHDYTYWQKFLDMLIHSEENKHLIFYKNSDMLFFNE